MIAWVPGWTPGPDAAANTREGIARWADSEALWRLVAAFGGSRPGATTTQGRLEWLEGFSAQHWDFRRGRERNLATSAALSAAQADAAMEHCPALGLAPSRPHAARYDAIIMTGGMVRAGLVKPRFVRALLQQGVTTSAVVFLGAHRAFAGDEHRLATALGILGGDEVDGMLQGAERAFPPVGERRAKSGGTGAARWTDVSWRSEDGTGVSVVAAPSSAPDERRADTADTFWHWARRDQGTAASVLVVTTPVYVPYQAACAVEVLGAAHGMTVETVGVDAAANDLGEHTQRFLPQHHLQELRSAIRGIRSLDARLETLATGPAST